jgi:hypothetical protein
MRTARDGQVVLEATLGGTAELRLTHRGRRVASSVTEVPPGRSVLPLPGPPRSRVHLVTVVLRTADGRVAADGLRMLTGPRLAARDARPTIESQAATDDGDNGVGVRALRCRSLQPLAVTCRLRFYDSFLRPSPRSELWRSRASLRVGADGLPRIRGTSATGRRPRIVLFE